MHSFCEFFAECQDIIRQCLKVRPQSRPHLEDILNHAWMTIPLDPPQTSPSPSISPSPSPSLSPSHSPSSSASGHPPVSTNCPTENANQTVAAASPTSPATQAVTANSIKADAKMSKPSTTNTTSTTSKKSDELPPVNVNVNVTVSVAAESVSSTGQSGASMESTPPPYL